MSESLTELEQQRAAVLRQIAALGDFRPGSITEPAVTQPVSRVVTARPGRSGRQSPPESEKANGKT